MSEPIPTPEIGPLRRPVHARDILRLLSAAPVAAFAAGALAIVALTIVLHLGIDRSSWHLPIPLSFRRPILAYAVLQGIPLAVFVGLFAALATRGRRALPLSAAVVLTGTFFLLLVSWATFWATGQFLDGDTVVFALASPRAMLHHVLQLSPTIVLLIPLTAVVLAASLVLVARLLRASRRSLRLVIAASVVLVWLIAAHMTAVADRYLLSSGLAMSHPEGGSPVLVADLIAELRENRAAPVAYLRAARARDVLVSEISPAVEVEWRPLVDYHAQPPSRPYNVVLLVIESLRSDELAAYGSDLAVMPAVDRLADDAAVFLDHYAVASHSNYSAVAPVSSQYPLRHESQHIYPANAHYPRVHLYDVLKPLGYRTAIVSSQNEMWGGMANFLASEALDHFYHAETHRGQTYVPEEDAGFARYTATYGRAGKIDDGITIDETIAWLDRDEHAPFFVYVNLQNSHVPYPIPDEAPVPFGPRRTSFPIRFNYFPADSAHLVRGVYRNSLHYVDVQIGRLISYLQQSGRWDDTIFMVMGDHGQAFFEHGFAAHGNQLYEELLRTPLIIRAPGLEPGPRSGLAQHVDVAPTVLELLGLPPHPAFQGVSLIEPRRSFAYAVVQTPMANQFSISHGRYKLVIDVRRYTAVLRDLKTDPLELHDWSANHPDRVAQLRERLDTWRGVQLEYYTNPLLQVSTYAPVLPEPKRSAPRNVVAW